MKKLFIFGILSGLVVLGYVMMTGGNSGPAAPSVHIGASVEEVEKVLGDPINVLPNFGRQLRFYKAKSGKKYTLIFEDDKLVEIQ